MSVQTYLKKKDYDKLLKVCEAEGCSPYTLAKMAILDRIHNYNLKEKRSEQPGETETSGSSEKTLDEKARNVAEEAKKIIERSST